MTNRILELYSGIGGMHCAWSESGLPGEIAAAVDINPVANEVYSHNFPDTVLFNRNIQSLNLNHINKLKVNTILMSPPCQPFTRNGKCLDDNDPRTNSFIYLIGILDHLENIQYILMENVKGFESSTIRNMFIQKLQQCQFEYQELLLTPSTMTSLPNVYGTPYCLEEILDKDVSETFLVPDKYLRHGNLLDICYKDSKRSCCFTKAYSHYIEGTGSVYTDTTPEKVQEQFEIANSYEVGSIEFVAALRELKLRFFTPKEVLRLMSFPTCYKFPENTTIKQCYRLLGNSVNVKVISELLNILFEK